MAVQRRWEEQGRDLILETDNFIEKLCIHCMSNKVNLQPDVETFRLRNSHLQSNCSIWYLNMITAHSARTPPCSINYLRHTDKLWACVHSWKRDTERGRETSSTACDCLSVLSGCYLVTARLIMTTVTWIASVWQWLNQMCSGKVAHWSLPSSSYEEPNCLRFHSPPQYNLFLH